MEHELITQWIEMPNGRIRLQQPWEAAELADIGDVEWAPITPYWSVLWRSGLELARELERTPPRDLRVVELGCGLGLPSIAAARAGAEVLATDADPEALALLEANAAANEVQLETARVDWADPGELLDREFDLVLAADVLYERSGTDPLLTLLPRLAPLAWVADPARPRSREFVDEALTRWPTETDVRGVVRIHRMRLDAVGAR